MDRGKNCCKDVVPFWAIIAMNFTTVGLHTLFKAATNQGMSYHIFIVYAYGVAALVLLPSPFFSLRSRELPPINFSLSCKILLLGLIGCTSQIMGYAGINYSSPALGSAISSLIPAFTFILALLFRMEKLAIRSSRSQAKIIGTIVSISGAFVVTLYKGPPILSTPPSISLHHPLHSPHSDWVLGGFFLTLEFILIPMWMEKLAIRSSSSQAKIIGTIVSISGAFVVTLYKGPPILSTPPSISLHHPLHSPHSNWVIGGLYFTLEFILVPMWYIVLTQIMKEYPAELTVMFFYNLCVSFLAATVGIIAEPNAGAWRIDADMGLVSILCSGIFGSFLDNTVNTWVLKVKGPVYVAMFKPLSIVIAVVMGVAFLGDTLYLGSIVGAAIISVGFYTVMWGKAKEDVDESGEIGDPKSASNPKVPLLQSYLTEELQGS